MNQIIESLYARKSVRAFTEQEIPEEIVQVILEASTQAPTAGNQQLYTILRITDPVKKHRLSISCDNQPFIEKAKLVLVYCADCLKWYKEILMIRKRFVFNGRVQGVGFRYLTRRAADLIGVTGWVRNERDGSVTLEIQGTEEQVDGVMLALKHMIIKRGRYVRIESIDEKDVPPVADETGFRTRF